MDYEIIYKKLCEEGYYIGTFDDFWQVDQDGITKEQFDSAVKVFIDSEKSMETNYNYRHNYLDQESRNYLKNSNYTGPIPTEEDLEQTVPYSSRHVRHKFIEDIVAGGANTRTTQQWALSAIDNAEEMHKIFDKFTKSFVSKIYKFLEPYKKDLFMAPQFSIYKKGDFSEVHYDGGRAVRTCALIIYFADPSTWNNSGGRLVITKTNKFSQKLHDNPNLLAEMLEENHPELDVAIPTYGNYVILDFIDHDVGHAIEVVNDDNFTRYSLITFVGMPGSDKQR